MSKNTILSTFLGAALLTFAAACSNDREETKEKEINTAQAIEFKVSVGGYNADQEVGASRAAGKEAKVVQQTVDLGDGLEAEYTLQRDAAVQEEAAATRALGDGTYTMLVYDAASHAFKGELTGTVVAGTFQSTSTNQSVYLTAGRYDFVLFNNKFTRSGNTLTVTRADAGKALIGRTTQNIADTPKKQTVQFALKHPAAQVKIKLTSDVPGEDLKAKLEGLDATAVPGSASYDAPSGTWTAGAGEAVSSNLTFGDARLVNGSYVTISNEGTIFLLNTDVRKLKLTFTAGRIYNTDLANKSFTFANALNLELNGAYTLNVNLKFGGHKYLFTDGTVGGYKEYINSGGKKKPAGVVVDEKNKIAIALTDVADNGDGVMWCENKYQFKITNTHNVSDLSKALTAPSHTSGFKETWNPRYSTSPWGTAIGAKGESSSFPAFKAAAQYGQVAGTPKSWKWFLPSYADWKAAFAILGLGNSNQVNKQGVRYTWYGGTADKLFTQAGGTAITKKHYWTSTEHQTKYAGTVNPTSNDMGWYLQIKGAYAKVRPFVKYP
jgi:hypothetical protein